MKTNKFLTIIMGLVASLVIISCVQDDDYTIPTSSGDEENTGLNNLLASSTPITVTEAKSYFVPGEVTAITADVYVKGYVSSSDQTGNFYKEFYFQDSPSNPTAAIRIVLNQVDSYNQFNLGREVYVNLNGLFIGEVRDGDGVITIGGVANVDNEVEALTTNMIPAKVFRSQVTETIEPLLLTFSQINDSHIGMYVMVENAQFPDSLNGEFYVDPMDDFDTSRSIQSCQGFGYTTFPLETSSFANFAQTPLPTSNGGTIAGIIAKTFNGSNLVMALNSTDDVKFDQAKCEPLDINDFTTVFNDTFDTGISNWTTFSVLGSQVWGDTSFGNPGPSAYMNGFSGGAQNNEDWLISPAIDLTSLTNSLFFFETDKRYDGPDLEVYFSTDYTSGDPTSNGTWIQVDAIMDPDSGSWNTWTNSGSIDISDADGQMVYIAFKYTSNTSAAATFELDNVTVLGL